MYAGSNSVSEIWPTFHTRRNPYLVWTQKLTKLTKSGGATVFNHYLIDAAHRHENVTKIRLTFELKWQKFLEVRSNPFLVWTKSDETEKTGRNRFRSTL